MGPAFKFSRFEASFSLNLKQLEVGVLVAVVLGFCWCPSGARAGGAFLTRRRVDGHVCCGPRGSTHGEGFTFIHNKMNSLVLVLLSLVPVFWMFSLFTLKHI